MKVVSADAKSISFEFFDGTNIGPGAGHMQHVTFSNRTRITILKTRSFSIMTRK